MIPARRLLAAALAPALIVAACGGADQAGDVFDFAEILSGEVRFEFDASGTVAELLVDTTVEAVCAVAYGTTDALGSIATDTDMAGGAHTDHRPLLTGLEPDTEYVYRLQGSTADGRLFQSELMTFRTPAADPNAAPGENAATGSTVTAVSSEFSAAWAAANAVDGDRGTEWSSAGDGDDAFIEIDLGRAVDAVAVGYTSREMTDGTAITLTYTVTVDGAVYGPFPAGEASEVDFSGRIVRFDVATSTGGNVGAVELAVYERS